MSVSLEDELEDVSNPFSSAYIGVGPKSSHSCVGLSAGGGVCGNRVRRAPDLPLEDRLEASWRTTAIGCVFFSGRGWLRVVNTLAALPLCVSAAGYSGQGGRGSNHKCKKKAPTKETSTIKLK